MYIINKQPIYAPLNIICLAELKKGTVSILDGDGDKYLSLQVNTIDKIEFKAGGALGTQTILHTAKNNITTTLSFKVKAKTSITDSKNIFAPLLQNLYLTMVHSCSDNYPQLIEVENKLYYYFIFWLRDHTHTMKGMKYFSSNLKTGFELYADTQREDGMVYDRIKPRESAAQGWRDYTFKAGDFAKIIYSNKNKTGTPYTLQRIPVENDVEYLFIECLYYTWKATGDTEWMQKYLNQALKAVKYATSDPWRWSKKYKLLKRAYTIDTWDFMHSDDSKLTLGDNVCELDKTTFGIMFGDNTGMAASCKYLAEMLKKSGRNHEADKLQNLAKKLLKRLNKLAWKQNFYHHHISENPEFKRDVGDTDESKQVTLSNAYSINRGIGTKKAGEIIKTYQTIRKEMPENSPGEFYNCYPPFAKGFGKHGNIWQYMNGGVSTIVAGEIARGAFCFGEEAYGADILLRINSLAEKYNGHLHICFNGNPQTKAPAGKFTLVNFGKSANTSHTHFHDSDWGEKGNDLKNLPTGNHTFNGIPFKIDKKGLGLKPDAGICEIHLPLEKKCASLYFLHTMDGSGTVAEVEVIYTDGEKSYFYLEEGKQLDHWFMPKSKETNTPNSTPSHPAGYPDYQLAWQGKNDTFNNVGTYVWGWNNPQPKKKITELVLRSLKNKNKYLLSGITASEHPVWFPQSAVSFGIPDAWGAAAIVYALVEGLAGVTDKGNAFSKAEISPRWQYVDEKKVDVTIKYEASESYVAYSLRQKKDTLLLTLTSSAKEVTVHLPLKNTKPKKLTINGVKTKFSCETISKSKYVRFKITKKGVFKIKLQ